MTPEAPQRLTVACAADSAEAEAAADTEAPPAAHAAAREEGAALAAGRHHESAHAPPRSAAHPATQPCRDIAALAIRRADPDPDPDAHADAGAAAAAAAYPEPPAPVAATALAAAAATVSVAAAAAVTQPALAAAAITFASLAAAAACVCVSQELLSAPPLSHSCPQRPSRSVRMARQLVFACLVDPECFFTPTAARCRHRRRPDVLEWLHTVLQRHRQLRPPLVEPRGPAERPVLHLR